MKKPRILLVAMSLSAAGCTARAESDGATRQSFVCENNPALQVDMILEVGYSMLAAVSGAVTSVKIAASCDIRVTRLRFRMTGADGLQYVVGTKGTRYFTDWSVLQGTAFTTGDLVMGPLELPNALPAGSIDTGPLDFVGDFPMKRGDVVDLKLNVAFAQTEDAPGEFKHGDKRYVTTWNDGQRPFEFGDVFYADNVSVPPDRIKTPAHALSTEVNLPQKLQ